MPDNLNYLDNTTNYNESTYDIQMNYHGYEEENKAVYVMNPHEVDYITSSLYKTIKTLHIMKTKNVFIPDTYFPQTNEYFFTSSENGKILKMNQANTTKQNVIESFKLRYEEKHYVDDEDDPRTHFSKPIYAIGRKDDTYKENHTIIDNLQDLYAFITFDTHVIQEPIFSTFNFKIPNLINKYPTKYRFYQTDNIRGFIYSKIEHNIYEYNEIENQVNDEISEIEDYLNVNFKTDYNTQLTDYLTDVYNIFNTYNHPLFNNFYTLSSKIEIFLNQINENVMNRIKLDNFLQIKELYDSLNIDYNYDVDNSLTSENIIYHLIMGDFNIIDYKKLDNESSYKKRFKNMLNQIPENNRLYIPILQNLRCVPQIPKNSNTNQNEKKLWANLLMDIYSSYRTGIESDEETTDTNISNEIYIYISGKNENSEEYDQIPQDIEKFRQFFEQINNMDEDDYLHDSDYDERLSTLPQDMYIYTSYNTLNIDNTQQNNQTPQNLEDENERKMKIRKDTGNNKQLKLTKAGYKTLNIMNLGIKSINRGQQYKICKLNDENVLSNIPYWNNAKLQIDEKYNEYTLILYIDDEKHDEVHIPKSNNRVILNHD